MVKRQLAVRETRVRSLVQDDPLEKGRLRTPVFKGRLPTPVFWPGEFHGRRSLAGYSPWGRRESDTTETIHWFMPIKKLFAQICS